MPVIIDETGWLHHGVELRFARNSDGTIHPRGVRVGPDATVDDVLAHGNVFDRSTRYNRVIGSLRRLREQLDALIQRRAVPVDADSVIWPARQALRNLDEMIVLRQSMSMGHGTVRVATLDREIEYLRSHHAHLAAIIASAVKDCSDPAGLVDLDSANDTAGVERGHQREAGPSRDRDRDE